MSAKLKKFISGLLAAILMLLSPGVRSYAYEKKYKISLHKLFISTTDTSISLNWEDTGADAYLISVRDNSAKEYTDYKQVQKPECVISGLAAGTEYKLRITSLVRVNGEYADRGSITPSAVTKELPAPSDIKAKVSGNNIVISWKKQEKAAKYGVFMYDPESGDYGFLGYTEKNKYTVKAPEKDRRYKFRIFAVNGKGRLQTLSEPAAVFVNGKTPDIEKLYKNGKLSEMLYGELKGIKDGEKASVFVTLKTDQVSEDRIDMLIFSRYGITKDEPWSYKEKRREIKIELYAAITDTFIETRLPESAEVTVRSNTDATHFIRAEKSDILRMAAFDEVLIVESGNEEDEYEEDVD